MTSSRLLALVAGVIVEFGVVVAVLHAILPDRRSAVDYLVIGTLATFLALATVFGVLMLTHGKPSGKDHSGPANDDGAVG